MEAASVGARFFPAIKRENWLERLASEPVRSERLHYEVDASGLQARAGGAANWKILQRVDDPDPARANTQALTDLENGADGLTLVFEGAPNSFGYGLPASPEALRTVLAGVPLDKIHLRIDAHPMSRTSVDWMVDIFSRWPNVDPARLSLAFGVDPGAIFAGTGRLHMSIEALQASMPQSLAHFFSVGAPAVLLEADGRVLHNAGATDAQELGVMLAAAVGHLRMFEDARQPVIYAAPHMGFALAAGQDPLSTIVKIRALRKLWAAVEEHSSLPSRPATIHAETSFRMMSRRDPETNLTRNTLAAAAAVGGTADSVSILPHTMPVGLPEKAARRIALATQTVMKREVQLRPISNPSPAPDLQYQLIASLCETAWEEFRRIENEGGLLRSLLDGRLQERVLEARQARIESVRGGQNVIVGATVFEPPVPVSQPTLDAPVKPLPETGTVFCEKLLPRRLEEDVVG
jgi:methylmalonyl-CoA mutase